MKKSEKKKAQKAKKATPLKLFKKFGIEIEGGWEGYPPAGIVHDGSVRNVNAHYAGEVNSPAVEKITALENFIEGNYPFKMNSTCGIHVHFSFLNNFYYSKLMDLRLTDILIEELERWKETTAESNSSKDNFQHRLDGDNTYCRREYRAEQQTQLTSKDSARYTVINYCFRMHGTIEVRVLPTFEKAETAITAVKKVKKIIEDFLKKALSEPEPEYLVEIEPESEEAAQVERVDLLDDSAPIVEEIVLD